MQEGDIFNGYKIEMVEGEEFVVQVLNLEGNQNLFAWANMNMMPIEGVVTMDSGLAGPGTTLQATNLVANPFWVPIGPNLDITIAPTGISMGPFPNNPVESIMQFNSCQEWTNYNAWGPSVLPLDAGTNAIICGVQQMGVKPPPIQNESPEVRNYTMGSQTRSK